MGKDERRLMKEDMISRIREELFRMQDLKYRELQKKLIPTADPDAVIGVRTPELRQYAKQLVKTEDITVFLRDLPHRYFDEDQLHAFIVSEIKDYDRCVDEVDRFLPYVNNWATCDQMSPKVFKKHREELLLYIRKWIGSGNGDRGADPGTAAAGETAGEKRRNHSVPGGPSAPVF